MTITALLLGSSTIENWKHFHIPNQCQQRNKTQYINRGIRGLTTNELFSNQYTNHITKGIRQDPAYIILYNYNLNNYISRHTKIGMKPHI